MHCKECSVGQQKAHTGRVDRCRNPEDFGSISPIGAFENEPMIYDLSILTVSPDAVRSLVFEAKGATSLRTKLDHSPVEPPPTPLDDLVFFQLFDKCAGVLFG
jgi:hypothetical protein